MRNFAAALPALAMLVLASPGSAVLVSTVDDEVVDGLSFHDHDVVRVPEAPGSEVWLDGSFLFPDDALVNQNIDALSFLPDGDLLFSTASSTVIGGLSVKDGDLLELDLATGEVTLFLKEGAQGQPVDVDAVHVLEDGRLLLSFQKEEVLDGQPVHDGDVILYDMVDNSFSIFLAELETFDVDTDINGAALLPNGNLVVTVSEDTWIDGLFVQPSEMVEIDPVSGAARIFRSLETRAVGAIDIDAIAFEAGACNDGVDGDDDGLVDANDPGCAGPEDDSERDASLPCDDGLDNDGDGFADHSVLPGQGDPGCMVSAGSTESPACQDGIDNNGDGRMDYDGGRSVLGADSSLLTEPDPSCVGLPWRDEERGACGLGFEAALLLLPLLAARERRLRRPRPTGRARVGF